MTIPLKQSTDVNAKTAVARLEQIKAQLNLTPSPMSLRAPQDMKEEKAAASFDTQVLAQFWAGGERQYRLLQKAYDIIKSDPQLVMQPPRNFLSISREEAREFTMGQIQRAFQLMQDPVIQSIDKDLGQAILQALSIYSESFGMRLGVHTALFRNVLLMLGSEEQLDAWLPEVDNYRIIGCFAMTELGHSSALRDIETTATYDQATDEFIIDSPTITSTKWWIGMAAHTATHTMIIAQTFVGGKHVGHNWFIVQLRDKDTGELMPNLIAGDVGHKVGRQGIDNGWIQFRQVRIPRANMLARWVSLDRDGTYTPAPTPAVMYATLIPERIMLVLDTIMVISQGIVIATRYGVTRRQGHKNQQIMDYQSHYANLLPATAFMYMVRAGLYTLDEQFKTLTAGGNMDPAVYINHMSDMHAISASLKGLSGWYGADILETCRRACGGHAYSAYNYIGQLINDYGVLTTGGGDNVVLLQQTASILLQRLSRKLKHDDYPKLLFKSSTHYMLRAKEYLAWSSWDVQDVSACCSNLSLIEEALNAILVKRLKSILDAQEKGVDKNDLLKGSVRVAEMHAATFLFSDVLAKFDQKQNNGGNSELTQDVVGILQRMTLLWGLHTLHTYSDQGYKSGFLTAQQVMDVEALYLETCKGLRKQAIGLTDSFGYPDFVLKAPIAKHDGNIYEAYFDTVLMQPNSIGKPEYHDRYIKPLTERK